MTLVLWSGGCDSTLILHDLLKERAERLKLGKMTQTIRTIAINHPNVAGHNGKESIAARRKILAKFRKDGHRIDHSEVTLTTTGHGMDGTHRLPQAAMWLGIVVPYLIDEEDLYVGYVRGDDVWHHWQRYQWAFQYLAEMCGRTGSLKVPLEFITKGEVIERIKAAYLIELVWWCESPKKGKPCMTCGACKTHARWSVPC